MKLLISEMYIHTFKRSRPSEVLQLRRMRKDGCGDGMMRPHFG